MISSRFDKNYIDAFQEVCSASRAFVNLRNLEDLNEIETIRSNLLAYCKLDTLAMVEIWKKIRGDL